LSNDNKNFLEKKTSHLEFTAEKKMVRTKVFVGNLSFKTRDNGLATEFEQAGKVISATIVTRGRGRSLGYGFVEFENEEAANKAVQILNKKELDGREINVEIAKPREEPVNKPEGGGRGGPRRSFQPRGGGGQGFQRGFRGGPGGGYRSTGYAPRGGPGGGGYPRRNFPRRGGFTRGAPRPPRKTPEERNLQPSTTGLFVTNLPFKFTDDDFGAVFTEAGTKPKSAKVVRNRNGRSKGYGFVEFENNGDQQKALKAVNGKTVAERELVVKIAMIEPQGEQKAEQAKPAQPATQPQGQKPATTGSPAQPAPAKAEAPKTETKPATGSPAPAPAKKEEAKPAEKKPEAKKEGAPASPKTQAPPKK